MLVEAMRIMVAHRAAMMNAFALPGDPGRTTAIEAVGLIMVTEFFWENVSP